MTTHLQLNPPLPVVTKHGSGLAHILIDYGPESDLYWVIFMNDTNEIWTLANRYVRADQNITLGRINHPKFLGYSEELAKTDTKNERMTQIDQDHHKAVG